MPIPANSGRGDPHAPAGGTFTPRVEVNDACSSILPANGGSEEDPYPGRQSRPESSATARFERPGIQGAGLKPLAGVEGADKCEPQVSGFRFQV